MALTAAEKQRRYRARKKKEAFFSSDSIVLRVLDVSKSWENRDEVKELLSYIYDVGKDRLTQDVALLILEFAAVRNTVFSKWMSRPGAISGGVGDNP